MVLFQNSAGQSLEYLVNNSAKMTASLVEESLPQTNMLNPPEKSPIKRKSEPLKKYRPQLEKVVEERTAELRVANQQLQHEIAEHKRVQEVLRESEEKLRLMFEAVTDGIAVTDLGGVITEVNERVLRMYGFRSRSEVLGKNALELIAERDRARAQADLRKTLDDGIGRDLEYDLLRADGSEFPGEISASLLRNGLGNPIGFIAISRDTTERKRTQEQLIVTDRLASIGELASGLAHELNNPLTSVIGFSQLLLGRELDEDTRKDLQVVSSEAQRCATVVRNLLTFARKHTPVKQLVDLNQIVRKVLELRAYEHKTSNIQVITRLSPDLPEIVADYFQLQQVFLNIVINAEFFMKEAHGKGILTISTAKIGNSVKASFADDGPGIASEHIGHIFDPFFTTKEVGRGTGLGLSICHGIITEHGGQIHAESECGRGATFIVELPITENS